MKALMAKYYAFKFVYLLSKDWKDMPAFDLGIIDENGNVLKKTRDLTSSDEKNAYTSFHVLVFNLKRLLEKVPLGKSTVARYSAAVALLKEEYSFLEDIAIEQIKEKAMTDDTIENIEEELNTTGGIDMTDKSFAGSKVFNVDSNTFSKSRMGKTSFCRYKTYVGEDEIGTQIREYGRKNPGKGIILQDSTTGSMLYLKRPGKTR
jgi:hypothetical protein